MTTNAVVKQEVNNQITAYQNSVMDVWKDKSAIKAQFAPNATDNELDFFMSLGMAFGANPFAREIWLVKYGTSSASIFLGRDFYRKKGQAQPSYAKHVAEVIYENDEIEIENGIIVKHKPNLKNPGKLVGAYFSISFREASGRLAMCHRVKFDEYSTGNSLWKSKPETMIKKVVESQGFRMAYQDIFAGTYDESELWADAEKATQQQQTSAQVETAEQVEKRKRRTKEEMEAAKAATTTSTATNDNVINIKADKAEEKAAEVKTETKTEAKAETKAETKEEVYKRFCTAAKAAGPDAKLMCMNEILKLSDEEKKGFQSKDLSIEKLEHCIAAFELFVKDVKAYEAKFKGIAKDDEAFV